MDKNPSVTMPRAQTPLTKAGYLTPGHPCAPPFFPSSHLLLQLNTRFSLLVHHRCKCSPVHCGPGHPGLWARRLVKETSTWMAGWPVEDMLQIHQRPQEQDKGHPKVSLGWQSDHTQVRVKTFVGVTCHSTPHPCEKSCHVMSPSSPSL